ncbi:helix-turn-helix transcriptional regulator [Microbacterium sp. TNHR37B]|uniref:helix-turn-helix transcriptional regulator n=1 Tax=Microbacterium sp. TNHR37B TaxID=1775956 RepID=UPI000832B106|nr:AraC family transcriptional regulator [Microbacterium sp. TNHR37B]
MLRFDPPLWDRAPLLPSIIAKPYVLTTNVVPADSGPRARLIAPPHTHPDPVLVWCQRGAVWLHLRDAVRRLAPGRGLWVPAGVAHTAHQEQGSVACFTYVSAADSGEDDDRPEPVALPRAVREMLLYLDVAEVAPGVRLRMQEAFLPLLRASAPDHDADRGRIPLPSDERIRDVVSAVLDAPDARHSLTELARAHSLHERTIARIFQSEVGMSFGRWRTLVRMVRAEGMLDDGATVAAAAAASGYDSVSAFAAVFKAHSGRTPREYGAEAARATA